MRVNVYASFQEAPRITSVDVSERSISLRWTIKPCSPTHPITGYEVKLADTTKPYVKFTNTSEWTIYNLKPYTKYNVSIRAVKQVGYGVWSIVTTIRTAIAKPLGVPFEIKVSERTSQSITLQWKLEHADLINGPFKGYVIKYTPQGGETKMEEVVCKVVKKCTTHTLTSLRKYTPYSFRVAVMNERLTGPFSTEQHTRTMQDKPNRSPAITTMEPLSSTSILLKWKKVDRDEMNGPFKAYRIFYTPQGRSTDIIDVGDSAIFNLTSLLKYTTYRVTIAAMNEKFVGPQST
ncbi:Down syndrome cell adhesion molecule homolog, partial [Actinia tenebrosa]|uniref:Down syndrome cell adhesion molecule homolog n=1 Tax=Actinia tenebrosa TaxID=6105 RepID=A0A6P8H6H7_ACTTE